MRRVINIRVPGGGDHYKHLNKLRGLLNNKILIITILVIMFIPILSLEIEKSNIETNRYKANNNQVSYAEVKNALTNFYNKLKYRETYVLSTDKFLCTGENIECGTSEYTNIGLINKDELSKIGSDSYLIGTKNYWTMTKESTNVYRITSNGIELVASTDISGIRPTIYLESDTKVTGKGTASDPYVVTDKTKSDVNMLAIYINGTRTDNLPTSSLYELTSYTCNKTNVTLSWNINASELTIGGMTSAPLECTLNFNTYSMYADLSGANFPQLASNMIPVTWNGSAWVKANVMSAWYDYSNKRWANAVVVTSSKLDTYKSAASGTTITEADVLVYYVWIPRYAYKITNGYHLGGSEISGTIQVEFLSGITSTKSGVTIGASPTYSGSVQTNFVVHPAFNFGGSQIKGMWIPKFEMTGSISTPCTSETCSTASITSKPYISGTSPTSLRNQTVGSMYYASRSMERPGNQYGFVGTEVDTHMMKNTEWGAITYLAQSSYGKSSEVWINNNSNYYTGCGGDSVSASSTTSCNIYTSSNGQQASTTGNVYGIYDMSGGSYEYTMGNFNNNSGGSELTASSIPNQYIDRYTAYGTAIYGDAIYETSSSVASTYDYSWYGDCSDFVTASVPWFRRGGYYSITTNAGLFNFYGVTGVSGSFSSFRAACLVGV